MAQRLWTPDDLPVDFKLFEWDFARNDKITLDANAGIAAIADNWQGRLASTPSLSSRRTLETFNGVQGAYKPGGNSNTDESGLFLSDFTGLPTGNADRYMAFVVVHNDGIIGGYGNTLANDYWLDAHYEP